MYYWIKNNNAWKLLYEHNFLIDFIDCLILSIQLTLFDFIDAIDFILLILLTLLVLLDFIDFVNPDENNLNY